MGPIGRPHGRSVQVTMVMRGPKCLDKAVTESARIEASMFGNETNTVTEI